MLKTEFAGEEIIHRILWRIVREQVKEAQDRREGWFYPSLIAQVFAFHTVEAYLNYVGERIAPEVWKDERNFFRREPYRGAEGKLRMVLDTVGIAWAPDERPLHTVLELKHVRDLIAHGKPEKFSGTVVHEMDTSMPYPSSELKAVALSKEKLSVTLTDVEEFLNSIQVRARPLLKVDDVWFRDEALQGPYSHVVSGTTLHR